MKLELDEEKKLSSDASKIESFATGHRRKLNRVVKEFLDLVS